MDAVRTSLLMQDAYGDVQPTFPEPPRWYRHAACEGSPLDFVTPGSRDAVDACLEVCEGCPVREPCGAYAASEGFTHGIWGGLTETARQQARKDDRAA